MKISIGSTITLVRLNGSQCPLIHSLNVFKFYQPIIQYDMVVASDVYVFNGESCFDVKGDSGTKNKGLTEGTRRVSFRDLGIVPIGSRQNMKCGGITKTFTDKNEANKYVEDLFNEKNIVNIYTLALKMWSMPYDEKSVLYYIKMNNLNKI